MCCEMVRAREMRTLGMGSVRRLRRLSRNSEANLSGLMELS